MAQGSGIPIHVDVETGDIHTEALPWGMATDIAPHDYAANMETLSFMPPEGTGIVEFAPYETEMFTVSVTLMDDDRDEHNEVFARDVDANRPTRQSATARHTGTIEDDDAATDRVTSTMTIRAPSRVAT